MAKKEGVLRLQHPSLKFLQYDCEEQLFVRFPMKCIIYDTYHKENIQIVLLHWHRDKSLRLPRF